MKDKKTMAFSRFCGDFGGDFENGDHFEFFSYKF